MNISVIAERQRRFFQTGKTKPFETRKAALIRLERALQRCEEDLNTALYADLGKNRAEAFITEFSMVLGELAYTLKHLKKWMQPEHKRPSLGQFPGRFLVAPEPCGLVLIMSPWNYPLQLTLSPLIGAIAAGNCCVVKPSNYSPNTSRVMAQLLEEIFPPEYIAVVQGGREENTALLDQRFDYIFFTGGETVGKLVLQKAATHLTPVTLELGGKSPCIIEETANISIAAKRVVFGKFLNSGQTCVAPDYLLVQESVKVEFLLQLRRWINEFYGADPLTNPNYPRMVSQKHFDRVLGLIKGEKVLEGGRGNPEELKIEPTILDISDSNCLVMQEEIFGPVLPVIGFQRLEQAEEFVAAREHPLALYLFTRDKQVADRIMRGLQFGGGCVNDTIVHMATPQMPFGGVGNSGMGRYHGKATFDTFTYRKTILMQSATFDLPMRYPPYTARREKLLRRVLK